MTAALEGGGWSTPCPGRTLRPRKTRYPLYRRLGGPQGRSGRSENLAPTGIRSPDRPACCQSLYLLSYPVHTWIILSLGVNGKWEEIMLHFWGSVFNETRRLNLRSVQVRGWMTGIDSLQTKNICSRLCRFQGHSASSPLSLLFFSSFLWKYGFRNVKPTTVLHHLPSFPWVLSRRGT